MNKNKILAGLMLTGMTATIVSQPITESKDINLLSSQNKEVATTKTSLVLKGYWGGNPYVVTSLSVNDGKIVAPNGKIMYFSYAPSTPAYKIQVLNNIGKVIKEKLYTGSNNNNNVYKDFNGLQVDNGDIIKVTSYGLDMSYESGSNVTNIKVAHNTSKTVEYMVNNNSLKLVTASTKVNPVYYALGSNKIEVSGSTLANKSINVWIDGEDYQTTSNSNGIYNVTIDSKSTISNTTNIDVFVDGAGSVSCTPQLNPKIYQIQNNEISIANVWNQSIGTLKLNPNNNTMEFTKGWAEVNPYLAKTSEAFSVSLYGTNGNLIKSVKATGGEHPENDLYNAFNGLHFSYGDIIKIGYKASSKIDVSNFNGNKEFAIKKDSQFQITKGGLVSLGNDLTVNPVNYVLNSGKTVVEGKTIPNKIVNVWVNGKDFLTTSDNQGNYKVNVDSTTPLTSKTSVEVFVDGQESVTVNPIIDSNIYKIVNNKITLVGNWSGGLYTAGQLGFNPVTMKLEVTGRMGDYFGNGTNPQYIISLYNKNGNLIKQKMYVNNNMMNQFYKDFNGIDFQYGDIIKVSEVGNGQLKVSNFDGQKDYLVNKSSQMKITENGLVPSSLPNIVVNPLDILGQGKITNTAITGKVNGANKKITVLVDGKTFTGESNANGDFSIGINDANGFTVNTQIEVSTNGELTTLINPTADTHLGILTTNITISDKNQDGIWGQTISFDPATMTIKNSGGKNYAAQLISGATGKVIASCGTSNFNVFASNNDLNNAHFQYGDIISVYESKETELSMGELLLDNGKSKIDATNQFQSFEITPNGLVSVANKNLTTSKILYQGNNNMIFTGKTLANTNVTVNYGSNSQVVKSDAQGNFTIEVPVSEAPIGTEFRVFVNNKNNENLVVNYDSNSITINTNRIQIINNTNVPIFDIMFDPVHKELKVLRCNTAKDYTGAFYSNNLSIKLINPTTGQVIDTFTGNELNDINALMSDINGKTYANGDILEVSYNPTLVKANIYNGKDMIGNTTGAKEYFEIGNKGLTSINNKFINIAPLNILGSTSITHTNILGIAKPNATINISVDGNIFKGKSNSTGNFNIEINDSKGLTNSTKIVVTSEGYIPTTVTPQLESNIGLQNSYINFYNSDGWQANLVSSITFNPLTMELGVNNYTSEFGNGKSSYFKLEVLNSNKEVIMSKSFNNGSTSALTEFLNGKSFKYGDIIGLSYDPSISKPVILNGNKILGNISGEQEYFKITKAGLVQILDDTNSTPISSNYKNVISNSNDIESYINKLSDNINRASQSRNSEGIIGDSSLNNDVIAYNFITRAGVANIEKFYNESSANKDFLNWVLNKPEAMSDYLNATNKVINVNGLQIWSDIWNKYTNSRSGFNLKLAIATSIANATPISAWPNKGTVGSPVERYNIFETLNAQDGMLPIFKTLNIRQMIYVVNTHIPNDQILEMRSIILQNHNSFVTSGTWGLNNIAYTIEYNERNPHTGASVFGPDFYGKNPTVEDVWYDGGVCGATSYLGSGACQVFGVPAHPIGQPGHCAFIFDKGDGQWTLGNNIYGWKQSIGSDVSGWSDGIATNNYTTNYDLLYENINTQTLSESNEYLWLANSETSYNNKLQSINKALAVEPLNVGAWLDKINLMKNNSSLTVQDYMNLSNQIISALKDYPVPMYDVVLQLKDEILNNGTEAQYNQYVGEIVSALNGVKNKTQKQVAQQLITTITQQGIEKNITPLVNSYVDINNVWNQSLGKIGFNPATMKLTAKSGWASVNPYLHGTAFTLGLYGSNNKLIKSLDFIGGQHPGSTLSKEFNKLSFNYGDKIVINYSRSSKIAFNNSYKGGVLDKSTPVKTSCVYEITPRGLVYIGTSFDSMNTKSSITTKVTCGSKVLSSATITGGIGDEINLSAPKIPNGYKLKSITLDGNTISSNELPSYFLTNSYDINYNVVKVKSSSADKHNTIKSLPVIKTNTTNKTLSVWQKFLNSIKFSDF